MDIDLARLEKQLSKRLAYPYVWGKKQDDDFDRQTSFIYNCRSFLQLQHMMANLSPNLQQYALNRWLNFWSAQGIEQIFATHKSVLPNPNPTDKCVDFWLDGIAFDHKSSVFPKGFGRDIDFALQNKTLLIDWLYQNQSRGGRFHYKNRLFVLLYSHTGAHWRLKARISLIKRHIDDYLNHFCPDNLYHFTHNGQAVYADVIWVLQR